MSLPDTAEYWWDVKGYNGRQNKHIFTHAKGCQCGHFHVCDTKVLYEIDCRACLIVIGEIGNIFGLDEETKTEKAAKELERRNKNKCDCGAQMVRRRNKISLADFLGCSNYPKCKITKTLPLRIGERVSHEDYSSEIFVVTKIEEDGTVTTSGGKNGVWVNDIELIIRNPKI